MKKFVVPYKTFEFGNPTDFTDDITGEPIPEIVKKSNWISSVVEAEQIEDIPEILKKRTGKEIVLGRIVEIGDEQQRKGESNESD